MIGSRSGVRVAVLEIGSRAARMLVAEVDADGVRPVATRSVLCPLVQALGQGRDATRQALADTARTVDAFTSLAREYGAVRTAMVGTEAMRRLSEGGPEALPPALRGVRLLTPAEEVRYTVLASAHGPMKGARLTGTVLVVDQGGGSLEVAAVRMDEELEILASAGLDLGAARLLSDFADAGSDLRAFRHALAETLPRAPFDVGPVHHAVIHGSVATKCAWISINTEGAGGRYDPHRVQGVEMEVRGLEAMLEMVVRAPHAQWDRLRPSFDPLNPGSDEMERVVTGAAALALLLRRFGLDRFKVSSLGPRHGLAWAMAQEAAIDD